MSWYVYKIYDQGKALLYVGSTCKGVGRIYEHSENGWFPDRATIEYTRYSTQQSALDAETDSIRTEQPLNNIKDKLMPPNSGYRKRRPDGDRYKYMTTRGLSHTVWFHGIEPPMCMETTSWEAAAVSLEKMGIPLGIRSVIVAE